ncbi:radical SAM protein [Microbacterium sp. RU33B]|uniref:radical SAM protein n=1 Tax=Microbacterium sp. RU33B TaxID=1907390 RepID=UPI00095CFC9A|nr:radical SAM protein [Microbacterium sp. RU33B]SIT75219.1 Radical SAM superfamily enzyme, MoaA/NifB/PqqE/SkfB family [Microbacterium sp. RU33B]
MRLTADRGIVQVHPTRRCNLTCLHCYSSSGPRVAATTPLELLTDALDDAVELGYSVLSVSGGEPLLYRPLLELLAHARSRGMRTTVTTNGLLLSERRLAELHGLLDVLAISVDGTPETHDVMRNSRGAFARLSSRLPGVARSGIPFGFITTLTQSNVDELDFVVGLAGEYGAGLVQVHPLEPVGAAASNLAGAVPDDQELGFAMFEGLVQAAMRDDVRVHVDIARPADIAGITLPITGEDLRLGDWLTPLVIETDGAVVPLTYGFPRRFGLGRLEGAGLADLARRWDAGPFVELCTTTRDRLIAERRPFFNWYEEMRRAALRAESGRVRLARAG